MIDDDLWWLWCGTECDGHFIGPFDDQESARRNAETTDCQHDHATLCLSLVRMAKKLPASARLWDHGIYDGGHTPTRLLIRRPYEPLEDYKAWPVLAAGLVTLKEWSTA